LALILMRTIKSLMIWCFSTLRNNKPSFYQMRDQDFHQIN
jgi:hypothetical protein